MTPRPSPLARISRHLRPFPRRGVLLACLAGTVLSASSPWVRTAVAEPRGARVVAGNVNFARYGNKTVIRASNGSIINYDAFNINAGEIVRFIQPNAQSRVLNRISGNQPTLIAGSLFANGHVYFINTAGVTFSNSAVVSTGGIVAAACNISDADFSAGRMHFTGGSQGGTVRNDGTISSKMVSLIGKQVINTGTINAPNGWVVLAAGDDVFVGEASRHVLVKADLPQGQTQTQGVGVDQSGTINARGGRADFAAGDLYSTALRISGVTTAGKVRAVASGEGSVEVTGRIDASNQGQTANTGGRVHILGHDVTLDGAQIDATGTAGGGEIRIGGDVRGGAGLPSAETTIVKNDSRLDASATGAGKGGSIVVWANKLTRFEGTALADSTLRFSGGLVETSSAGVLNVGAATISAKGGTWLLDPAGDLVIGNADPADGSSFILVSTLNAALNAGGSVSSGFDQTSMMSIPLHATGDIFITANILKSSGGDASLLLSSDHGIDIASGVTISNTSIAGALDLTLSWGSAGTGLLTVASGAFNSAAFSNLRTVTYDLVGPVTIQATASLSGQINATTMISNLLNTATNVRVISTGGDITATTAIAKSAGGDCTLSFFSDGNVIVGGSSGISAGGGGVGKLNLDLRADTPSDGTGSVQVTRPLALNGGDFHAEGQSLSISGFGSLTGVNKVSLLLDTGADVISGFTANSYEIGGRTGTLTLSGNLTANTTLANGNFTFLTAVDANNKTINITTGTGKISFLGDVSNAGNMTLTSTNTGADAISVLGISGSGTFASFQHFVGNTTLNGTYTIGLGASSDFSITGNTTLAGDTSITNTVGADGSLRAIHFGGAIDSDAVMARSLTLDAGTHRIALDGGAGITLQLSRMVATGSLITSGLGVKTVGDGSMNPSQLYTGDVSLLGTYSTGGTDLQIDGNASLAGDVIFNTGAGAISLNGTVTGNAHNLGIRSDALAKVTGNISGVATFSTDTAGTANGTTELDGTLSAATITFFDAADLRGATYTSTTGSQTYGRNVTNNGSGDIAFVASTSGQSIGFQGDFVGGAHALTTMTSGLGTTQFAATHSVTASAVTINGGLSLIGIGSQTVSIDTSAAGGNIDLDAVDGTPGLSLNAGAGQVILGAAVGGSTPLAAFDATAASIALQNVSTVGAQSYHGAATLSGASITLSSSAGGQIAFDSTITGTVTSLTVNTSGNTSFGDDVSLAAGSLTTDAMGTTTLEAAGGGFTVTAGPINIQDNLVLTSGAYSFLSFGGSSAANRNQSFGGTITALNAGASLLLDAGNIGSPLSAANRGNVTVTGAIGGTGANLGNLQVFGNVVTLHAASTLAGSQDISGDDVTLNGAYNSGSSAFSVTGTTAIRLGSNASVATTNNATFTGPVVLQGHDLAVNADSATRFTGTVSGVGALSTNAAGTTRFDSTINVGSLAIGDDATLFGATATTAGDMTFSKTLTLENNVTLASTGGNISMLGLVDGLGVVNAVNHSLTLNVAAGQFSLIDATATHIDQLLSSATGKVQIRQSASPTITANLVNLSGGLDLLGTAGQTVFITTAGANGAITLNTITGPAGLNLNSGSAKIAINGAAGTGTALGSFTATSTNVATDAISVHGVATVNDQNYHAPTTVVGANVTIASSAGGVAFDSTLRGTSTLLTVNSPMNTIFGGDVTVGGLSTDAAGHTILGTAAQPLFTLTAGPVTILDDTVIRADMALITSASASPNQNITFGKTISADTLIIGAGAKLTLDAGGAMGGNITVGGIITVGQLMVSGDIVTVNGAVTNIGGQMITGMRVYLSGTYDTGSSDFYVGLNSGSNSIWLAENSGNTHKVTVSSTGNITFDAPMDMRGFDLDVHTAAGKIAKFNFAISNTIIEPGPLAGGAPLTHNLLNTANLLVDGPGSVEFHGSAGDTTLPDYLALGSITIGSGIDATAASAFGALYNTVNNITLHGPLTLESDAVFRSSAGDISMLGAVQGTGVVNATRHDLGFDVADGHFALIDVGASGLDALTSTATGEMHLRTTAGNTVQANSVDLLNDLVLVGTNAGKVSITTAANNGAIHVGQTITGAPKLDLQAGTGLITLGGAVSGIAELIADGGSYSLAGVSTVGDQHYAIHTGAVSPLISFLGSAYTITGATGTFIAGGDAAFVGDAARTFTTGGGNLSFQGTLTGSTNHNDLAVHTTGDTTFGGEITGLGAISTDVSGHTIFMDDVSAASLDIRDIAQLHGSTIFTTGFQSYSAGSPSDLGNPGVNSIELFANVALQGDGISMYKVAGGGFDLASQSFSSTDFRGDVSGVGSLSTDAFGTGTVVHDGVTLAVHQAFFGDNAILGAGAAVNASGSDSSVTFGSTATLQDTASVSATGANAAVIFQGFTFIGDGASVLASGSDSTVDFLQSVSLTGAAASIDAQGSGSRIVFEDAVDGAAALTIGSASTSSVQFGGDIGAGEALDSLMVHGAVSLAGGARLLQTSGDMHFFGSIDGGVRLTLASSAGDITLDGAAGQLTALTSLDAMADTLTLNSVRTEEHQIYTGSTLTRLMGAEYRTLSNITSIPPGSSGSAQGHIPETIGEFRVMGDTQIGANTTIHTGTGLVTFYGAVDDTSAGAHSLAIQVDNAFSTSRLPAVRFAGNIGSGTRLGGLSLNTSHGTASIAGGGGTRDNASVLFAGANFLSTEGVYNADGRLTSFPDVKLPGAIDPTLGADFHVHADTFEMGSGARLLSFGNLTIEGMNVTLGSLNVVGTFTASASASHLTFVNGANIVSSGLMTLSGVSSNNSVRLGVNKHGTTPNIDGLLFVVRIDGDLSFASFQAKEHVTIIDNLARGEFPQQTGPDTLVILQPAEGIPLDFINEFSVSPTISDQDTVRRFEPASVGALAEGLKEFNLDLLDLDPLQLSEFFIGRSLYSDLPQRIPARANTQQGFDFKVTRNRLQRDTLESLLNALKEYLGDPEGGVRTNAKVRGEEIGSAWDKFCKGKQPEECTIENFKAYLEGPEATPESRKSYEDLEGIMVRIRDLGLSPQESRIVRNAVISKLQKGNKTWEIRLGKPAEDGARNSSLAELLQQHFNENVQLTAR